jgi:hypothetical protein
VDGEPQASTPGAVPPWNIPVSVPPWQIDPTENVKALAEEIRATVAAAIQRQDDLRERDSRHAREMRQMARMYEGRLEGKNQRLDAKDELIRQAEAARIDAIQTRSDLTVERAALVQAQQQEALAKQVAGTADTFRISIATELAPIKAALAEVQRAQYETQGQKQQW